MALLRWLMPLAEWTRDKLDAFLSLDEPFGEPPPNLETNRAAHDRSMLWGIVDIRPVESWSSELNPGPH
jgi:hypothetical protein